MRKTIALILSVVMLAMLLAGCGGTTETAAEASEAVSEAVATDEPSALPEAEAAVSEAPADAEPASELPSIDEFYPVSDETTTLTMWTTFPYNLNGLINDFNEVACYQEAEKRTNVHIEFNLQDQSTASEKFNLMVAAEDFTDIINGGATMYTSGRSASVEDEIFVDVYPYIDEYAPHYAAIMRAPENVSILKDALTDEGYMPSMTGTSAATAAQGLIIRQDWLDELGIAQPKTVDQLTDALVAIKEAYTPSNTVLMTSDLTVGRLWAAYDIAWGTESNVPFQVVDGEVVCSYYLDNYKKAIELLADWYQKDLMGDFLNFAFNQQDTFILSDNAALWSGGISYMNSNYVGRSANPNFNAVAMSDVGLTENQAFHMGYVYSRSGNGGWSITRACENLEAAMKYINWYFTDEGFTICNYGVEGVTHTFDENGDLQYTDMVFNHPLGVVSSVAMVLMTNTSCPFVQADDRLDPVFENDNMVNARSIWLAGEHDDAMVVNGDLNADEGSAYSLKATDIATTATEVITRIVVGESDMSDYDAFLEQIQTMGIDECTEIKAAAYERYAAR